MFQQGGPQNKAAITSNYFVIYCRIDLLRSHEYVG